MSYLKYIGTAPSHGVGVVAENSSQVVYAAQTGVIQHLDDAISAAVLEKEPTLWEAVSGFTG